MGLTQEDITVLVKFLQTQTQTSNKVPVFVLDEYSAVGAFWERIKKAVKEDNYDFDGDTLDLLSKILNICLLRNGNEKEVLRTILDLLDKVETIQDTLKQASATATTTDNSTVATTST
jgi:hypothetical protein